MGNACCRGACCFIFASQHSASTLLVFLLVLATTEDKNYFTFKWLWQQAAIGQGHQPSLLRSFGWASQVRSLVAKQ
jgi:hypothetical protein